jgi:hypothetical protein
VASKNIGTNDIQAEISATNVPHMQQLSLLLDHDVLFTFDVNNAPRSDLKLKTEIS